MSQEGILDVLNSHPSIPTLFIEDVGSAVPALNELNVFGGVGIHTIGSGNTITISSASGKIPIDQIAVDTSSGTGTNPVLPTAGGLVTVTGGQVAAGTIGANVIRTDSTSANSYTTQIQRSQAVPVSNSADNGVSHFDNNIFSVDANGFVTISNAPYISLSPYIVGQPGDAHAGYTTIQTGITAAVAAGASAANPLTVYVKPGTYTENLTLADGIVVQCMNSAFSPDNTSSSVGITVFLNGTVTLATGISSIFGMGFTKSTGNITNIHAGTLLLSGCWTTHSSNAFYVLTTTGTKNIYLHGSSINGTGTSKLMSTDGSNMTVSFLTNNNFIFYNTGIQSTISGAGSNFTLGSEFDHWVCSWIFNCGTFDWDARNSNSINNDGTHATITTGANVSSGNILSNVSAIGSPFLDLTLGSGVTWELINAGAGGSGTLITESASNNVRGGTSYLLVSSSSQQSRMVFATNNTGWRGSSWQQLQGMIHTTSGSAQTIATIPVPAGTTVTVQGFISAANTAHSDMTGGNILVTADGTAAAIVGAVVSNVNATTTGTFGASFSGGNLLIQVTAPSASAYDWAMTYEIQPMLSNG